MKTAAPIIMWAVIVVNPRSEWIHWETISRLKRDAWAKYAAQWLTPDIAIQHRRQGKARLELVTVALLNQEATHA